MPLFMNPKPIHVLAAAFLSTALLQPAAADSLSNTGDPLPSKLANGDPYPTSQNTILSWINIGGAPDMASIASHGWALWEALSSPTDTPIPGFTGARLFNTWMSPEAIRSAESSASLTAGTPSLTFTAPGQFSRIKGEGPAPLVLGVENANPSPLEFISESVAYSPTAAQHAAQYTLFKKSSLASYLVSGQIGQVPDFPNDAMVVKPVYTPIVGDALVTIPAWPGTPVPAKAFPSDQWGECVYVDPKNQGRGDGSIDVGCTGPTPQTTYNVKDFIALTSSTTQKVTASQSDGTSKEFDLQSGDSMILMGMHVSTREIDQWTWQTFWWTPTPTAPHLPSSATIASHQSSSLTAPASNYAMALAYSMVEPAQPTIGGKNVGTPVIAYNPHLEAPFNANVFNVHRPINGALDLKYGVQSNCMTCHAMAHYAKSGKGTGLGYGTDFYIGRDDPAFIDTVQTDFLWSIPDDAQ